MAPELRHNLTCLWPSEIAEQFYCEYKVHLKRLHPEVLVELPPLELGEASHAALASQAEPIRPAEIEQSILAGKKLALCEWVLEGVFQGVRIRGRPDFFAFEGKKAHLLLDFKFSRMREPFRNHEVQVEVYALLAESMGFSTDDLCCGIVMFPPAWTGGSLREAATTKAALLESFNQDGTLQRVYEACEQARVRLLVGRARKITIDGEGWTAFLFRFDRSRAAQDLTWALGYWLGERESIPEKRYWRKCFACPLNAAGLCEHALHEPDPGFEVNRRPDGQIFVFR